MSLRANYAHISWQPSWGVKIFHQKILVARPLSFSLSSLLHLTKQNLPFSSGRTGTTTNQERPEQYLIARKSRLQARRCRFQTPWRTRSSSHWTIATLTYVTGCSQFHNAGWTGYSIVYRAFLMVGKGRGRGLTKKTQKKRVLSGSCATIPSPCTTFRTCKPPLATLPLFTQGQKMVQVSTQR